MPPVEKKGCGKTLQHSFPQPFHVASIKTLCCHQCGIIMVAHCICVRACACVYVRERERLGEREANCTALWIKALCTVNVPIYHLVFWGGITSGESI